MKRARIVVGGVVQGVGFRPYVYRLAGERELNGWVLNSTEGVVIEVEGARAAEFVDDLPRLAPPLARIDRLEVTWLPPIGYANFAIHHSEEAEGAVALVSPDLCTCDDCRRELFDPADRRYLYPFINCTNCGPRFTIVRDIPYDRPKTTMSVFPMCPDCRREYDDPTDRRFHAQPNACPVCGPRVWLEGKDGSVEDSDPLATARRLLREGAILAVKGLGGFHLACDAANQAAVDELRRRKGRVEKPFAVMARDLTITGGLCYVDEADRHLLESPPRPIVLLRRRPEAAVAAGVAPGNPRLGVMLPYTPLHFLLMAEDAPAVLVMTSGNLSEEPIATDNAEARVRLGALADAFLLHDRDIHVRCDDSVTRAFADGETVLRRSRGYAPYPVRLGFEVEHILACGAELKNTFCLARDNYAFLSQHVGDLENLETLRSFEQGIDHFQRLFRVKPRVVAYDLHPNYLATRYALDLSSTVDGVELTKVGVQHHHAHVASCMAENGVDGKVIGVAMDGTGYGADGTIWGGEFLVADFEGYVRAGHLGVVPLPGGDAAVKRPYRAALSYAFSAFDDLEPALSLLRAHAALERDRWLSTVAAGSVGDPPRTDSRTEPPWLGEAEVAVLGRQVRGQVNSPPTSSCGRLFDAVSALAGVRQVVNYEGQAAIELEALADPLVKDAYPLPVLTDREPLVLDHRPLLRAVVAEARAGVSASVISARFHNALAVAIGEACRAISAKYGLDRVVLSGGVFQNTLLLALSQARLRSLGLAVYIHRQVPCNDGGLSLGQAVVAHARTRK